jgi:uncharacterized protein YxjI
MYQFEIKIEIGEEWVKEISRAWVQHKGVYTVITNLAT